MTDDWITYSFGRRCRCINICDWYAGGRMQFYAPQLITWWSDGMRVTIRRIFTLWPYGTLNFQNQTKGRGWCGSRRRGRNNFISAKYEKMWANIGPIFIMRARLWHCTLRTEYNEIASWFMIQYSGTRALKKNAFTLLFDCLQKCSLWNWSQ